MKFAFRPMKHVPRHPARIRPTVAGFDSLEARELLAAQVSTLAGTVPVEMARIVPAANSNAPIDDRFVSWLTTAIVAETLPDALILRLSAGIENGMSRHAATALVLRSPQARQAEVENVFEKLLDRTPTDAEMSRFLAGGGRDQIAVMRQVLSSREYFEAQGGTARGFVESLALKLLGRPATEAETARWTGLLQRRLPRNEFVGRFLRSPEFVRRSAERIAWQATPAGPDPALVAQIVRNYRGDSPMTSAKTVAFASTLFAAKLANAQPIEIPASFEPSQLPPNYVNAITPSFSLNAAWQSVIPGSFTLNTIGASPQGKAWFASTDGLEVYDLTTQASQTVFDGEVDSVAPISDTFAWFVAGLRSPNPGVYSVEVGSPPKAAPVLPGGDFAASVAAAADGTVWVLGQSGAIYSYDSTVKTWQSISTDGFKISSLSIGSATNVWAIGESKGQPVVLNWSSVHGWVVETSFDALKPNQVAAAADGSVWVAFTGLGKQDLMLRRPGGSWGEPVSGQSAPGTFLQLVAFDQNRVLAIYASKDLASVAAFSTGLVNGPATPFPTPTDQWSLGYEAINQHFGIVIPNGIRGLYGDGVVNLSGYSTDIQNGDVAMPLGVTPDNWTTITGQIVKELNAAVDVQKLFAQLSAIQAGLEKTNKEALQTAVDYVGLTDDDQSSLPVVLGIGQLLEAAFAGVATLFTGGAATVAAVVASYADAGVAELTGQSALTDQTTFTQTYDNLYVKMTGFFDAIGTQLAKDEAKILGDSVNLGDYRMLMALGDVLESGLWYVPAGSKVDYETAAQPTMYLNNFQALTISKWQIVEMYDRICTVDVCPEVNVPAYDRYNQVIDQNPDGIKENVWFVHELGASTDPSHDPGPFPSSRFLNYVFTVPTIEEPTKGLGVNRVDFFTGKNGWGMSTVIVQAS